MYLDGYDRKGGEAEDEDEEGDEDNEDDDEGMYFSRIEVNIYCVLNLN